MPSDLKTQNIRGIRHKRKKLEHGSFNGCSFIERPTSRLQVINSAQLYLSWEAPLCAAASTQICTIDREVLNHAVNHKASFFSRVQRRYPIQIFRWRRPEFTLRWYTLPCALITSSLAGMD